MQNLIELTINCGFVCLFEMLVGSARNDEGLCAVREREREREIVMSCECEEEAHRKFTSTFFFFFFYFLEKKIKYVQ
jgi:hypothetical protein